MAEPPLVTRKLATSSLHKPVTVTPKGAGDAALGTLAAGVASLMAHITLC
jgi:hypothetical protein